MAELTQDRLSSYDKSFQMFAREGEGFIKPRMIGKALKYVGFNPRIDELEMDLIEIDQNSNGKIEFDEFLELTERLESKTKAKKEAKDSFNAFDFMGEGYIAANDLKEALLYIMEKASVEDKQNIIKHFKLEKNRKIYFAEFKEMITMRR